MRCLVIGSSVIDFFSTVSSKEHVSVSNDSVTFQLGDKIPVQIKKHAFGGNGMNAAIGLNLLDIPTTFYTYLGSDSFSHEIEAVLKKKAVDTISEKGGDSSDMSYILDLADDRIIFSHHPVRDHGFQAPDETLFDYIFLSSIGDKWTDAYAQVLTYALYSGIPIVFSPGSRQLSHIDDTFFSILHQSKFLLLNRDEGSRILKSFGTQFTDITSLCQGLAQLGPQIISLTDGGDGAYAYYQGEMYYIPSFSSEKAPEKTGAGDAYASGFLAGLLTTDLIQEAMRWGSLNAHSVMQEIGAQDGLLTKEELLQLLEKHGTFMAEKLQ